MPSISELRRFRQDTYTSKRYLDDVGSPTADFQDFDALAREWLTPTTFQRCLEGMMALRPGEAFVKPISRAKQAGRLSLEEARAPTVPVMQMAQRAVYMLRSTLRTEMRARRHCARENASLATGGNTAAMIDWFAPNGEPVYRSSNCASSLAMSWRNWMGRPKRG